MMSSSCDIDVKTIGLEKNSAQILQDRHGYHAQIQKNTKIFDDMKEAVTLEAVTRIDDMQ